MSRALNVVLLVACIGVCSLLLARRAKLHDLEARVDALAERIYLIEANDPGQYYLRLVNQTGLKSLVWQAVIPSTTELEVRLQLGQSRSRSLVMGIDSEQAEMRWGYDTAYGRRAFFMHIGGGISRDAVSQEIVDFLDEHWAACEIEIVGQLETAEIHKADVVDMLVVTVPPDVLRTAKLSESTRKLLEKSPLLKLQIGTQAAFQRIELGVLGEGASSGE